MTMTKKNLMSLALFSAVAMRGVEGHMSIFTPSMYGLSNPLTWDFGLLNPVAPIGPELKSRGDWWFRGPQTRSLPPPPGVVKKLPAGGNITLEITCHVAFSSFGVSPTVLGGEGGLDACPGNVGAYHAGDPYASQPDDSLLSGCALGIADKEHIEDIGWDDTVIFSVQKNCVRDRMTSFQIPKAMPPCTGKKCICSWYWLANNGTGNFYMTPFDCSVTNSLPTATPISSPVDPIFCAPTNTSCIHPEGAKRPLYAYNEPTNVPWWDNDNRPGYHEKWGFKDGPQDDIFEAGKAKADNGSASGNENGSSRGNENESSRGTESGVSTGSITGIISVGLATNSSSSNRPSRKQTLNPLSPSLSTSSDHESKSGDSASLIDNLKNPRPISGEIRFNGEDLFISGVAMEMPSNSDSKKKNDRRDDEKVKRKRSDEKVLRRRAGRRIRRYDAEHYYSGMH